MMMMMHILSPCCDVTNRVCDPYVTEKSVPCKRTEPVLSNEMVFVVTTYLESSQQL